MADKSIGDLNFAPGTVDDSNTLFVVQQAGAAYKLSGHEFILALTSILDGHGGIASITGPTSSGLDDTYTIHFADQTTTTFTVSNGNGVTAVTQYWAVSSSNSSVPSSWSTTRQTMTSTNRYLWSYLKFTLDSGTLETTKSVVGVYGDTGDAWYVWIRYAGTQPTQDSDIGTTPDDWIGLYSGTSSTAPTHYTDYTWYEFKGQKGDTGDPATLTAATVGYQQSDSGSVVPEGSWTTTVPTAVQGKYLWTRIQIAFNTGNTITAYSVSRYGIDGTGAVVTVNGVSPNSQGDVHITATDVQMSDSVSLQVHVGALETAVNAVVLRGAVQTITGNGTTSNIALTGLTSDHVVSNWGMYSDANLTTPIPENSPTCDVSITTAADKWSVTITNFSSTFYLRPTFVLKQN